MLNKGKYNSLICCILFLCCMMSANAAKRALVIGLGQQLDTSWKIIHGDKDVELVTKMLSQCGYTDIATLKNKQATKQGIVDAIKQLTQISKAGDIIYIHFSGHGQRMTDLNGDEADGLDESWIPYDAYKSYCKEDNGDKHLSDDELQVLLTGLYHKIGKSGQILVVVDACHSGDSTRGLENDSSIYVRGIFDEFKIPHIKAVKSKRKSEQWLTLSACKDYQLNQEHPNGFGKLTYAIYSLCQSLAKQKNNKAIRSLTNYMKQKDVRGKYPQTPVLSGALSYNMNLFFKAQ